MNPVLKKLSVFKRRSTGRNRGQIVTLYRGGGHPRRYRFIDFKRTAFSNEYSILKRIDRDPYRSALIGSLVFSNGFICQIILSDNCRVGDTIRNDITNPTRTSLSSSVRLRHALFGSILHGIELYPRNGQRLCRSAGSSGVLLKGNFNHYRRIKLRSGELRLIHKECIAAIGVVSNPQHSLRVIGKAGTNRWLGWRPRVRPSAMNPVDHPMGGRTKGGSAAKSRRGLLSTIPTRNNPRTDRFILLGHRKRRLSKR